MAKPIVRGKKEELLPYILRKINQIGQEVKNESKDFPKMKELLKREVAQRVVNWCLVFCICGGLVGCIPAGASPLDSTQEQGLYAPDTTVSTAVDGEVASIPQYYQVGENPAEPASEVPWAQVGAFLVAVWEVVVRLKPTVKDWSLVSRIAGILEFILPNRASDNALERDERRVDQESLESKRMQDTEMVTKAKWIGGRLWRRVVKARVPGFPAED